MRKDQQLADEKFMRRCVELGDRAGQTGDLPFGALVVCNGQIIGERSNILQQEKEVDGHAERIALLQAQAHMQSRTLPGCTVYTTVEPSMCSFPMRELHIERVVWGLRSPVMGGHTKFKVLQDPGLSEKILGYFGPPPEVLGGVLKDECAASWVRWVPELYKTFTDNGVFD
jgi:tRNA(adenine34) deaminase